MNVKIEGRRSNWRLSGPVLLALLATLVLGGSFMGQVQAGERTKAQVGKGQVQGDQSNQRPQHLVLRVYFRSAQERDSLAVELGAEEMATTGGYLTVLGDVGMQSDLLARGLRVEVDEKLTASANEVFTGMSAPNTFFGGFKTVEEMHAYLNTYASNFPILAEVVDYGDSWCKLHPGNCIRPSAYNGYDLLALHITNRGIAGPKPVFWFDTGIHSREIATPEVSMRFISWLLDGYNSDPDARWLVDYHDIWIVPMFNPDGHHIVEAGGGGSSPYYQRKNANNTNGCTTWPPTASNQFGTDNNRNFPFTWNCCGGSSSSPCTQTYRGTSAASDPETAAAVAKIRALIPDQRGPNSTDAAPLTATGILQSMHSNASLNLYPWGNITGPAPNGADLANIGNHLKATNASPSGNNYQTCQPGNCLYIVDGDTTDWSYGELGIASYTTEVSGSDFFVSLSYVDQTIWPANRGALIYQAKIARTPYLLAHGPDAAGVATSPMTVTQGTLSHLSATINFAWTGNSFSQNVGGAEYYIDTPPWAGGVALPMSATDGTFNSATEGAQADINTSSLSPGVHLVLVRGRGANQYQGHDTWGPFSAAWLTVTAPPSTPTSTATATSTDTPTSTVTGTPPTETPTDIPTDTSTPTDTPTSTFTPVPTSTSTSTSTRTFTATRTSTPTRTPTATPTRTPSVVLLCNTGVITISDNRASSPYPSNLNVSGLSGTISDVNVRFVGAGHTRPDDIDILLVNPTNQKLLLWSDAGGSSTMSNATVVLDNQAANALPNGGTITSGTYRPANYSGNDGSNDPFPSPAPAGPYTTGLTTLNGTSPNGTWRLYVRDDRQGNTGSISGGWCLQITTTGATR